jgi:CheY-like chemotaxis protein
MKKKLNCVLLVDDNESDNFFHNQVIKQAGITDFIEIALNGQEAIDFLTGKWEMGQKDRSFSPPALIFLDINMPVMDGWEFLEEYQKLDEFQKGQVVIIMLTASLNSADKARTEKILGSDCFIFKPLTVKMINEIIQKHFPEYL